MTTTASPVSVRAASRHLGGNTMDTEQVTARYRAAKKRHADLACRVGALRSEIASLESRASQHKRSGRDIGPIKIVTTRTSSKLQVAEADLSEAANDYRVTHVEMLMTPGPQRHYIDAISRQRLLAQISEDDNEDAVLGAMKSTLALILTLVAYRAAAHEWARQSEVDPEMRHLDAELRAAAATVPTGVFRSAHGSVLEVTHAGGGTLRTLDGTLGQLPFDYIPGATFQGGHLMLNEDVRLARQVDAADPTGYAAARSVMV